jgi:hypothetical protein
MADNFIELLKQLDSKINQVNRVNAELKDVIKLVLESSASTENKSKHEKLIEMMLNKCTVNSDSERNDSRRLSVTDASKEIVRFNVG